MPVGLQFGLQSSSLADFRFRRQTVPNQQEPVASAFDP